MSDQKLTYCRICEAHCGLVATVENGAVIRIRPDREHPLSSGFACPKGIAMLDVHNDPDRVLHPMRRRADGTFERVSWDSALDDIGARLRSVISRHGKESIGWFSGNPSGFSYSHPLWVIGFIAALGSKHKYSSASQDVSSRFVASKFLYGTPVLIPIPDLRRTEFLMIIGANPLVSHGSVLTAPRIKDELKAITTRGGRIVVVDPRRTETAKAFEHVAIQPDSDAWLLLAMLNVLFTEGLADRAALAEQTTGAAWLERQVADITPDVASSHTGIDPHHIRSLARDLAQARGGSVYGRTGTCLGRFGSLVSFLIDAVNIVAGQFDRAGGSLFGAPAIALEQLLKEGERKYSRIGGFRDVIGEMPASIMAEEITTPGKGSLRALFISAGNPINSVPNGPALKAAMATLDLCVGLDFYINDTNKHADYVLPCTDFLEREDMPLLIAPFYITPYVQWTEPVVKPRGEARQEWEIIEDISKRIGIVPSMVPAVRALGRVGIHVKPHLIADLLLRTSAEGDQFGLKRAGLSVNWLRRNPRGRVLADELPTGMLRKRVQYGDKRVHLSHQEIGVEIERLRSAPEADPAYPFRLIGMRELKSHNSWMHNVPTLMNNRRRHGARINPDDAAALGIDDGDTVRVASKHAAIDIPVSVTDEMTRGVVAIPHGWGHDGGWSHANNAGGVNVNSLMGNGVGDLEPLAGMAFLNGVPVQLTPLVPIDRPSNAAALPGEPV